MIYSHLLERCINAVDCAEITITVEMMLVHTIPPTAIFLDIHAIFIFGCIWPHQILIDLPYHLLS
jgi:hypothetical protein